jgi:hypothetical protein
MRLDVSKNLMCLFIMLLILLLQPVSVSATLQTEKVDTAHICLKTTQKMEKQYNIKKHLLTTIASIESGRWNEKEQKKLAWPWTINAQGKGYYFNTKAEAVQKVKELQKQGITSIDVGCMQINLSYHGQEFKSIEEAIDPKHNVEYAAKFLTNLYENNNHDWLKAAMTYHSSVPEKANEYRKKIVKTFEIVKTAHKDDIDLTSHPQTIKAPKNIITAKVMPQRHQAQAKANREKFDVKAWREAKLEEYRVQKMLARRY